MRWSRLRLTLGRRRNDEHEPINSICLMPCHTTQLNQYHTRPDLPTSIKRRSHSDKFTPTQLTPTPTSLETALHLLVVGLYDRQRLVVVGQHALERRTLVPQLVDQPALLV